MAGTANKSDSESDVDMQITWEPGLKKIPDALERRRMGREKTTWESYLEERKEKKKKTKKSKLEQKQGEEEDEGVANEVCVCVHVCVCVCLCACVCVCVCVCVLCACVCVCVCLCVCVCVYVCVCESVAGTLNALIPVHGPCFHFPLLPCVSCSQSWNW